jgi:hypothetical protein
MVEQQRLLREIHLNLNVHLSSATATAAGVAAAANPVQKCRLVGGVLTQSLKQRQEPMLRM